MVRVTVEVERALPTIGGRVVRRVVAPFRLAAARIRPLGGRLPQGGERRELAGCVIVKPPVFLPDRADVGLAFPGKEIREPETTPDLDHVPRIARGVTR